ncbi:YlbL family protein [Corynebacterium crudilactis]|uniref:endopeptidase La n=1 Tax=Corynebacterium crudilactis TaxID=1652495 RepID=A0A172QRX8_9CORY|nr:PDZ domain-containing protein [Corynebacterium crudilactis]ANE03432.1 signal protein PDZ [Corynebacterium crudilactis]
MNRRIKTLTWGAIPLVLLASLVSIDRIPGTNINLSVPYAAEGPGPTINTLGQVDGEDVISIRGADLDEAEGNLNMTTVSVRTGMTLSQVLSRWLFTDDTIIPIEQVFPPGQSAEEVEESNRSAFVSSESSATIAAMNYLDIPVEVEVVEVLKDSAATGVFEAGDKLLDIDGTAISTPGDAQKIVRSKAPGDAITIGYERNDRKSQETITLREHPSDPAVALLGISMMSVPMSDIEVDYNLEDIGGPSAGMMFSLAVVDKLSPGALNGGKFVAGTGTIAEDGSVGPIGGIAHKVRAAEDAGAEVFLSPAANCAEAMSAKPESITVLKVDSLSQAIDQMAAYNQGADYQTCS